MKRFKKVAAWTLGVILVLVIGIFLFGYSLRPDYDGEKDLKGLGKEVSVYFDTYGIPHLYADTETDAMQALGYVHAQDRLWQMELLRRVGNGGLSEIFGKDLLKTDRFFLALGIDDASEKTAATLDPDSKAFALMKAYIKGVNAFMEEGPTPVEFYLTGLEKRPFEVKDVYNILGYMSFSFAMAHKTDPLLTRIKDTLGPAYLTDLQMGSDPNTKWIQNYPSRQNDTVSDQLVSGVFESLKKLSIPLFEGSNSWVVGPQKAKNGKVIFANDPHIGFSQPSVWYEAHLNTPTYEKYGYYLAGVPFPLLAHDRSMAYGLTMFENDDVDFFFEENHPRDSTKYRYKSLWNRYEYVTKEIKVKDAKPHSFTYKKTVRGPIMNGITDQVRGERPVAMWWIYTQEQNTVLDALYGMSHAKTIDAFEAALPKIHAPGLNVMYGDAAGNVAWWACGKLYNIPDSVNTKLIQEREYGFFEKKDFLPFSQNPKAKNPPWRYVYSANNQPDSIAGMLYPGYYLPENRAKRIEALLATRDDWDREGIQEMLVDVTSAVDPSVLTDMAKDIDVEQLDERQLKILDRLTAWDGNYQLNSSEATLYTRWIYFFVKNIFEDELGEPLFKELLATHLLKRLIAPMADTQESIWWDDVSTSGKKESKQDIVQRSFQETLAALNTTLGPEMDDWKWEKVHTLEHGHPIGQIEALRSFFNVGPFPVGGSREVINNLAFGYDGDGMYNVSSGPSTRRVIDFSDVENSHSILPTGQSGNPLSKHYKDQAEMYVQGKFRKMLLNKQEIQNSSESMLLLVPDNE
ncbi:penicillin acylase family protein [Maribacter sp. 2-571]|uniref:penicillin acylase family protein n=1 Tax=Maribacter sp. 2-571 TaxID=3417569 RepID=UPI003D352589